MSGRLSSTRPSAIRWRWGSDRRPPNSPTWWSSPTSSTSARRPSASRISSTMALTFFTARLLVATTLPKSRLSSSVPSAK